MPEGFTSATASLELDCFADELLAMTLEELQEDTSSLELDPFADEQLAMALEELLATAFCELEVFVKFEEELVSSLDEDSPSAAMEELDSSSGPEELSSPQATKSAIVATKAEETRNFFMKQILLYEFRMEL